MRVAYVTPDACGTGHAMRGVALVQAGRRAGLDVRAFGPVPRAMTSSAPVPPEFEGSSEDWEERVRAWAPDLLLGDLAWVRLDALREAIAAPAWLLLRYMPCGWLTDHGPWRIDRWERRISIEPLSETLTGTTHAVPPIVVDAPRFTPTDGQKLHAGYATYWEAVRFGYRDRVHWIADGNPEREARVALGGEMTENGADALMRMIA